VIPAGSLGAIITAGTTPVYESAFNRRHADITSGEATRESKITIRGLPRSAIAISSSPVVTATCGAPSFSTHETMLCGKPAGSAANRIAGGTDIVGLMTQEESLVVKMKIAEAAVMQNVRRGPCRNRNFK
jgi:hypothetical protein